MKRFSSQVWRAAVAVMIGVMGASVASASGRNVKGPVLSVDAAQGRVIVESKSSSQPLAIQVADKDLYIQEVGDIARLADGMFVLATGRVGADRKSIEARTLCLYHAQGRMVSYITEGDPNGQVRGTAAKAGDGWIIRVKDRAGRETNVELKTAQIRVDGYGAGRVADIQPGDLFQAWVETEGDTQTATVCFINPKAGPRTPAPKAAAVAPAPQVTAPVQPAPTPAQPPAAQATTPSQPAAVIAPTSPSQTGAAQ
mgnify:CR=1 FL=1